MHRFMIGEMAELGGVSAVTLRYYDKKGLLRPEYTDQKSGYRYYTFQQLFQLMVIQYMRSMGLSTDTIKIMFERNDVESIYQKLIFRKSEIEEQIKALQQQDAMISHLISGYTLLRDHPPAGQPFLNTIAKRYLFQFEIEDSSKALPFSQCYEENLMRMMNAMLEQHISGFGYINIGCVIKKEHILHNSLTCSSVFSAVKRTCADKPGVIQMPNMIFLCNICDCLSKELEYAQMLYDECDRRGLSAGDYYREEIIFCPTQDHANRNQLFLQAVPVGIRDANCGIGLLKY